MVFRPYHDVTIREHSVCIHWVLNKELDWESKNVDIIGNTANIVTYYEPTNGKSSENSWKLPDYAIKC